MKKPSTIKPTSKSAWDTPVEDVLNKIDAKVDVEPLYDLEGLMTDFPTAKDLEKFLFDKTGVAVDLKGRSNKFKYQTALDILNGGEIPDVLIASENPYLDKNDLVPVDPMKEIPPRPDEVVHEYLVTQFQSNSFPHPDDDWKASGQKCSVIFRLYTNGAITYEIIGPIAPRAVGERVNKFGKTVPEKYTWVDPRTGEQVIRDANGRLTTIGSRLKAYMSKQKVNKTTAWDAWIDREFVMLDGNTNLLDNPWG